MKSELGWTNHAEMVAILTKPGKMILDTLTPIRVNLWHAATGVVGEAGELIDAVKKSVVYNKELDYNNIIEEMGDIEFYLEQMRQAIGVTREQVLSHNMLKLNKRYGNTYTDQKAADRMDKRGE